MENNVYLNYHFMPSIKQQSTSDFFEFFCLPGGFGEPAVSSSAL